MVQALKRLSLVWIAACAGIVVFAGCGLSSGAKLPPQAKNPNVVAVFDNQALTLQDFEERYTRTVGSEEAAEDDSLAEYEDFLERYVNFRLKVLAAEAAGVPSSPEVATEIRNYRTNLAKPYLLENEVIEPIVREIYQRQKQLNDVSHILIRVDENAAPEDTLAAYERASAIRDSVLQGMDFAEAALRYSEDPSARGPESRLGHGGRLGYFSAGRMVEPFETYAYLTPVGEVSALFRTRFGYHFLYVHDRKDAVPDVQLSHIMLRPSPTDSSAALDTMRVVLKRLASGEDFAELAKQYSQDAQSASRGGDIGFISYDAPIHSSFKDPAFALKEVGDMTGIVRTPYGLHIIKLTGRKTPQTFEESYEELKGVAMRLPRTEAAEREFALRTIAERGAVVDTSFVMNTLDSASQDSVFTLFMEKRLPEETLSRTVFTIGDSTYTLRDVADYAATSMPERMGPSEHQIEAILSKFVTEHAIDYEAGRLEERDPEFKRIMQEFRDGLVLFQFMEDSVWTAAERDTVGLQAYYDVHAQQYWWPERTRIVSLQVADDSLAKVIESRLENGESAADVYASFADDTLHSVRVDTMMVSEKTNSIYDRALELAEGDHTAPLKYRNAYLVLVNEGVEAPRQKTFDEARTQVVSDYQAVLEARLVARLRNRFNAYTFPERLVHAYESAPGDARTATTGG